MTMVGKEREDRQNEEQALVVPQKGDQKKRAAIRQLFPPKLVSSFLELEGVFS